MARWADGERAEAADGVGDVDDDAADLAADLDAPQHAPRQPRASSRPPGRRRRSVLTAVAVLVLALAVTSAVARSGRHRSGPAPLDGSATAEQLFPVLAEPAGPGSALPDQGLAADVGVAVGSERLLAVTPAASFWVAQDRSGGVCLVVRATDDELGRGGLCTSAADAARGVALPAGGGPSATLLPEGASTTAVEAVGDAEVVPGLWVDEVTAEGVAVAAVEGASTRLTVVPARAQRGSGWLPVLLTSDGAPYAVVLACLRPAPVTVSVDDRPSDPERCPDDVLVRHFTGDGTPVQVEVSAPDDLVWAAEVVSCTGRASQPTC